MCGICGIINRDFRVPVNAAIVKKMNDAIIHRGPDDEGQHVKQNVGLGMRRLSIIDLVTGAQPIYNEDKTVVIVFNGEIYNHDVVRSELEKKGHHFRTNADTEVIIHAYEEFGVDCVKKLNGMFAFSIWDERKKRLFIARDRIGIKPLYYYVDEKRIVFGSEIKSILQVPEVPREVDRKALDTFLTFEYIPSPSSIFKGIYKLPAGHWLLFENGQIKTEKYWFLDYKASPKNEDQLAEELREILLDAVKVRLMSDVPLGSFLSGGLDSSSIVAMMSKSMSTPVKSFSIGFDDSTYNELPYARAVAKHFNTDHFEEIIKPNAVELTEKIIGQLDEPFGDFSVFPTYLVSQMARKHVTVVLSGDGGDELLAGYDTYIAEKIAKRYARLPSFFRNGFVGPIINSVPPTDKKKGLVNKAKRFIEGTNLPKELQHVRWMIFLQEAEKQLLYTKNFGQELNDHDPYQFILEKIDQISSTEPLDQQEYIDIKTYLVDDILVKVDRMSMAVSLEARVPLLDHRFVEFAATIPGPMRLKEKRTKHILKKAMTGILPDYIINRGKEGFSIPIKNWMKNELYPMMMDALSESNVKDAGFFEPKYVTQLVNEHLKGSENHSHRLWALMMFHMWRDIYLKRQN
jgi:asparagine synthase (glutamine-hydrolysing)